MRVGLLFIAVLSLHAKVSLATSSIDSKRAHEAVATAVSACKAKGFDVTATVVNSEGQLVAVLRGDGAAPHTLDSSRQKAYTAASFSPIVKVDRTSKIAERLLSNQTSSQLAFLPNVLLVGGGISIRSNEQVIGAIGVGGAPGGDLDEVCADVGLRQLTLNP
jgi:uncharacterized protein GlcG (DUF336 family)